MNRFKNRAEAGRLLANALNAYRDEKELVVLALPRGGVPVAYEVAHALKAPLDILMVPIPHSADEPGVDVESEAQEFKRREMLYREGRPPLNLEGKTVVLVDDGLATGSNMLAALKILEDSHSKKIIAAVPLAPQSTCNKLHAKVDKVICLYTPSPFWGVGVWYEEFGPTSDEDVQLFLHI
ncbi:MAG: phosphoribosyltransferase [Chitinophagaceae bacterium]|nr:phosphoribosyltransferase [Oligoflexus sp.]